MWADGVAWSCVEDPKGDIEHRIIARHDIDEYVGCQPASPDIDTSGAGPAGNGDPELAPAGRSDHPAEGVGIMRDILLEDPGNFLAWHSLADLLFELQQPAQALDAYTKALELGPDRAYYHYRKALCLEQLQRHREAALEFAELLVRDPTAAEEVLQRSDGLVEAGKLEAAGDYLAALEKSGHSGPALTSRRLRLLLAREQWEAALPLSRSALAESPEDPQLRSLHAEILHNLAGRRGDSGDLEEAIRLFREAAETDPERFDIVANLGLTYLRAGRNEQALEALERALRLQPDQVRILNLVGEIYFQAGNHDQARPRFERSLALEPNQPRIRELLQRLR